MEITGVRSNRQAIYAKEQALGTTDPVAIDRSNAIPVSTDVGKTLLDDNGVEIPILKGRLGANDSVVIAETQTATIPTFPIGGGLSTTSGEEKVPNNSPLDPLIGACFHKIEKLKADLGETSGPGETRVLKYTPVDDPIRSATIVYKDDKYTQTMANSFGSMAFAAEVGSAASMTFNMQAAYRDPEVFTGEYPKTGNTPTYQQIPVVSGAKDFINVKGLPPQLSNCVTSFSFNQNATVSPRDCITREGNRAITYHQTGRAATGEITFYIDAKTIVELFKAAGGKMFLSAPLTAEADGTVSGLIQLGAGNGKGNTFVFGSKSFKIGAPTRGDIDGQGTFTCPITFIPRGDDPDYEFAFLGDLTA